MLAKRKDILALEKAMRGVDPAFQDETTHYFGHQTYCREMALKSDTLIVGKIHRYPCVNILSKGRVVVSGEFESAIYEAPFTWVSRAGTKRAVYCLDDCVWTTIHQNPSNTRDLHQIEKMLIADSYAALEDS